MEFSLLSCVLNYNSKNLLLSTQQILQLHHVFFHSWVFGDFLCKIYHFINCLSYTASIFILVVICMERYLAIQHPISSKQILTSSRLKGVIVIVWLGSVLYSSPKFLYVQTIPNRVGNEIGSYMNVKFCENY